MSVPDLSENTKPNIPMRGKAQPLVFDKTSTSSLQVIPTLSLPARVAIIGSHLPRQ